MLARVAHGVEYTPVFHVTAQIGNTESELKKLAEQNPELKDAYVAKQRRLKVSVYNTGRFVSLDMIKNTSKGIIKNRSKLLGLSSMHRPDFVLQLQPTCIIINHHLGIFCILCCN